MKKTVTVNLAGIAFIMDEDAHDLLGSYLDDVAKRLDGGDITTMQEIEERIAEMFKGKGLGEIRVVNVFDVREAIVEIGSPTHFGATINFKDTPFRFDPPLRKRLYRDMSRNVFGGVCSGLAAYMGVDITIIRIAMVLFVMVAGLSAWVYLILWIAIPVAATPYDKEVVERMRNRQL